MYHEILNKIYLQEMKDIDLDPLNQRIIALHNGEWWQSKKDRLKGLKDPVEVAFHVVRESIGFSFQIQELIAILAPKISQNVCFTDSLKNASDVIEACNEIIYEIDSNLSVNSLYVLEPETYEVIKNAQRYLPLYYPPKWKSNKEEFYCESTHCILGSHNNRHSDNQALDVLNLLQSIEWELDKEMIKYKEQPNKELTNLDAAEQFARYVEESKKFYKQYPEGLYFLWRFDKRGRMYSTGYHINPQSTGYNKAILSFAKQEVITGEL